MTKIQKKCCTDIHLELFRTMADKTRQDILALFLREKEINVGDVANKFTLSRPAISHHLNTMRRAKVLNTHKDGKEIYYSFNKEYVIDALEEITARLRNCC